MKPRIVRLPSPKVVGGKPTYRALSMMNDRFVAYIHGHDLHVIDLLHDEPPRTLLKVENGYNFATAAKAFVTFDEEQGFQRFDFHGDTFVLTERYRLPITPHPWPTDLVLSPSGRYLALEIPPSPDENSPHVLLLDALNGRIVAKYPYALSARASFTVLDGAEVLFLSAPSYMGVLFIDCASGRTLHSFEPTTSWDFCHTDYELSPDGTRLLTFGCVWACPYEARLYDATPWTRNASPANDGFPLSFVFRQCEDLEYETVFQARFTPTTDGLFDVNGSVSLHELQRLDTYARQELQDGLSATNLAILDAALGLEGKKAFLQRRVDPSSGQVRGFSLLPASSTNELHVHALPEHQALLVGETIEWFDGQTMHDVSKLAVPKNHFWSTVTSDGKTIVLRELLD